MRKNYVRLQKLTSNAFAKPKKQPRIPLKVPKIDSVKCQQLHDINCQENSKCQNYIKINKIDWYIRCMDFQYIVGFEHINKKREYNSMQHKEEGNFDHTRSWPANSRSNTEQNQEAHVTMEHRDFTALCGEDWCSQEMRYWNLRKLEKKQTRLKEKKKLL